MQTKLLDLTFLFVKSQTGGRRKDEGWKYWWYNQNYKSKLQKWKSKKKRI